MHRLFHFIETYNSCLTARHRLTLQQQLESSHDKLIPIPDFTVVSALHDITHILSSITPATQPPNTRRI